MTSASPILMSASMIQRTLASAKTETRRLEDRWEKFAPGDLLWVRETWAVSKRWNDTKPSDLPPRSMTVFFAAGGSIGGIDAHPKGKLREAWSYMPDFDYPKETPAWIGKGRPSIFLPSWASRLTLNISGLSHEPLHAMTETDFVREGGEIVAGGFRIGSDEVFPSYKLAFADLWDSLRGPGSYEKNPMVWVIRFALMRQNFRTLADAPELGNEPGAQTEAREDGEVRQSEALR